jgi:hypothetical protein
VGEGALMWSMLMHAFVSTARVQNACSLRTCMVPCWLCCGCGRGGPAGAAGAVGARAQRGAVPWRRRGRRAALDGHPQHHRGARAAAHAVCVGLLAARTGERGRESAMLVWSGGMSAPCT